MEGWRNPNHQQGKTPSGSQHLSHTEKRMYGLPVFDPPDYVTAVKSKGIQKLGKTPESDKTPKSELKKKPKSGKKPKPGKNS